MKKPITNRAASIRAKLLEHSRATKQEFQFVLDRWVAERFLFRLGKSELRERFVLKGATLFLIWRGSLPRRTRDVDLLGHGSSQIDDVRAAMTQVCLIEADDGVVFDRNAITAEEIREDADYDGIRVKIVASLDKARTTLQVDIGFGDVVNPAAENRELPVILPLEAPHLRAYAPETVIAEKFQAMVQLDMANSRMKDFYDIWLLCQEQRFEMERLVGAIRATFERRKTDIPQELPVALTDQFLKDKAKSTLWREFLRRAGLPESIGELHEIGDVINGFLSPVTEQIRQGSGELSIWPARGPWTVKTIL